MNISFSALAACISFYSGLYCIYYYFVKSPAGWLLLVAIGCLVFAYWITPAAYEKHRGNYTATMRIGEFFWYPLITWWRVFIWPISLILKWIFD